MDAIEKGLPVNVDAERFVLGSILLDDSLFIQAAGTLEADDFSLEKHRRIFRRMGDLQERNEKIDRVTVANELMKFSELEACDGLSYLVSLDDGLPQEHAWFTVKRQSFSADPLTPVGLYFGTTSGGVWASMDEGAHWRCLVRDLPEIYAVEAALT